MGGSSYPPLRALSVGFQGALFTSRDTRMLPFIWAGPFTSTERDSLQGMSGSKLLGGLAGCTDERETHQNALPPYLPLPSTVRTSGPSPHPPSFLCPSEAQQAPGAWYRGHLIFSSLTSSSSLPAPRKPSAREDARFQENHAKGLLCLPPSNSFLSRPVCCPGLG